MNEGKEEPRLLFYVFYKVNKRTNRVTIKQEEND